MRLDTRVIMLCRSPEASETASSATLAVSTQSIDGHASAPRSAIAAAFSLQGFHTTVVAEPLFSTMSRRPSTGSSTAHVARVATNTGP